MSSTNFMRVLSHDMRDVLIRVGLIAVLAIFCFQVFSPFLDIMVWALILAVTLYPLHVRLARRLDGRNGRAATVLTLLAIGLLLVPTYLLGVSMADSLHDAVASVRDHGLHVAPPPESVAAWPWVGQRLHDVWLQASTDLSSLARKFTPQLNAAGLAVLGKLAGFGLGLLLFVAALAIAGIIMAYGESGERNAMRIASRVFGRARGPHITRLCVATIRAVAQGVVGIAFIQMLLVGVAFVLAGVPGAGLLALLVLVLGIVQLPATLVTVPVIVYVLATRGADAGTIVFSVYVFVAGLADNVLKPLLLGRGVDVPMPVVLIGAIGGMVTNGIIGLFIGPVVLAVGYQLFWQWVEDQPAEVVPPERTPA